MRPDDFDFDLPEELIALRPLQPRPASRMLVAGPDKITDSHVRKIGAYLRAGDVLVLNDTKVIPGRLHGFRERAGGAGARVEVTLIAARPDGSWLALARPGKRLAPGDTIRFGDTLTATVNGKSGAEIAITFSSAGAEFEAALDALGEMPLPPYIAGRRAVDARDRDDYQTVFARNPGAVAAPTASLHFDEALLAQLGETGVEFARVTLHVGAGTFLPVKTERIEDHRMHKEWGEIGGEAVESLRRAAAEGRRILPVGTTALRVIETAASAAGEIRPWNGETDIFIRPGYAFRATSGLMTNFHLPRSTLMMLVSALMGPERIRQIYAHAIRERYRFFSYGDSSLLLPGGLR